MISCEMTIGFLAFFGADWKAVEPVKSINFLFGSFEAVDGLKVWVDSKSAKVNGFFSGTYLLINKIIFKGFCDTNSWGRHPCCSPSGWLSCFKVLWLLINQSKNSINRHTVEDEEDILAVLLRDLGS